MAEKFKYKADRRCKRLTVFWSLVVVAVGVVIFLLSEGYFQAWLYSILFAILALYFLSIPRYVTVSSDSLEIHCVVEMTHIPVTEIAYIRKVGLQEYRRTLVLLGSYGFFGYFGYYFDLRRWELIKVYATERRNLVEIEDIYEQKYLISCTHPDRLIDEVARAKEECTRRGCEDDTQ